MDKTNERNEKIRSTRSGDGVRNGFLPGQRQQPQREDRSARSDDGAQRRRRAATTARSDDGAQRRRRAAT
ncbi:hypothetical protein, partial [Rhizocola hellebori]|uniref:hypothetical protein n=1 Tax=Rhizocola hellebori TaxID=1392758 RepID=UPI0019418FBB